MARTTDQATYTAVAQLTDPLASPPAYTFSFAPFLKRAHNFDLGKARPICKSYAENQGQCPLGAACPDRHSHPSGSGGGGSGGSTHVNNLVCKHWLRGLCKKGSACEFLHEYNVRRMPECTHYSRALWCPAGDECLYQHIDPATKRAQCPHYDRGFCPLGARCAKRHVRKRLCKYYLAGFCPYGRQCKEGVHARFADDKELGRPELHVERSAEELEAERQKIREGAEREEEAHWAGKDRGRRRRGFGRGRGRF